MGVIVASMDFQELKTTIDMAMLELEPAQEEALALGVTQLLEYYEKMAAVDVTGVEATTHALVMGNRTRPDQVRSGDADTLLEQAPDLEDRFIAIPNVL